MTNAMMTLVITCPYCGTTSFISVSEDGYNRWRDGELVQNAFPTLSATDRETLISGLCPNCQDNIFGDGTEWFEED